VRRSRENRIIATALRCYPARWRTRRGGEAAVLASALLDDGIPWWSVAGSFLGGAVKERARRRPSVRIGSALLAVIIGAATVPLALFTFLTPANASSTSVTVVISSPGDAVQELQVAFATDHFNLAVDERPVATYLVGSILSAKGVGASGDITIREIQGQCNSGTSGCVVGLVLPQHYSGIVRVTLGVASTASTPMSQPSLPAAQP
jgi:hypothetical protein